MAIHHLNCGSMCPYGGRIVTGEPGRAHIVCHCLLIEAGNSLVLVDTGIGLEDTADPMKRLGAPFTKSFRVQARAEEAAAERIRALGLDPGEVTDIVCTHLDLDHAGGLPDFPQARVHVFEAEHHAAIRPKLTDRARYRKYHFAHGPLWRIHDTAEGGDAWHGFESIRVMPDTDPEVLMIPLPGHSRGHSAIAIREGDGWLLHCGDAYFHRNEMATPPSCPPGLAIFQRLNSDDDAKRRANQERLRELTSASDAANVRSFCSHDPHEFEREHGLSGSAGTSPTTGDS